MSLILTIQFAGCSKDTKMSPDENWIRVYDHSDLNRLFYSLDVTELTDKSFVILGSTKMDTTVWPTPYILYTSNEGIITRSVQTEDFISPVPDIIASDGGLYFFCMDNALGTHVLKINTDGSAPTPVKSFPELTYPLSASVVTGNRILLTSYNRINKSTVLTCFDAIFRLSGAMNTAQLKTMKKKSGCTLPARASIFHFLQEKLNRIIPTFILLMVFTILSFLCFS
ncbi:MAG: hypothetical protein IPJ37_08605 [Bacteroidales bacterium]|nr:hypothetical protein [Bacteroidales bacterium]